MQSKSNFYAQQSLLMASRGGSGKFLSRAGWSVVGLKSRAPEQAMSPPDLAVEGVRLVTEVANSWTSKYKFTIVQLGFDGQSAFHYECIFSCPTNELPVPSFTLSTKFALVVPVVGADPRLFYSFEEGDLRHEWTLVRDRDGRFSAPGGQQIGSLAGGNFERFMDRLVKEKETLRERGVNLKTSFEETRIKKPPAYSYGGSDVSDSETCESSEAFNTGARPQVADVGGFCSEQGAEMRGALQAAGLYCEHVEPPSSLSELLANIFDAADEGNVGQLPHPEVARLLSATLLGFGLELWDIHLLMTSAQENDYGFIEWKPFIQEGPELIRNLQKRRQAYRSRGLPGVQVPHESAKFCFSDDVTKTAEQLLKVFEQCIQDNPGCGRWDHMHYGSGRRSRSRQSGLGGLAMRDSLSVQADAHAFPNLCEGGCDEKTLSGVKRRICQDCLAALPERLSPQEAARLLQLLPEDDDGFILIEELAENLEHLRTEAMLNALVESDVKALRTQLVLRFRHLGLPEDGNMKLWVIKYALLQADQICLSRPQIHLLLCLAVPDATGLVDIAEFVGLCCVVIPHMFDARKFVDTAEQLIADHAEAMKRSENAELEALGARGQPGQADEGSQEKVEVDSDTVERTLQQIITLNHNDQRNPPSLPPETIFTILHTNEKEIQTTQLSEFELRGFYAEMVPDTDGLVYYVDHIKKWVPIIFEQRKNRQLSRYIEENALENLGIDPPHLQELESQFPLHLPKPQEKLAAPRTSGRRPSKSSRRESDSGAMNPHRSGSKPHADDHKGSTELVYAQRSLTKRRTSDASIDFLNRSREPPPGRGYQRRKARLEAIDKPGAITTKLDVAC